MKLTRILTTVLFSLCMVLLSSCSEDDGFAPISLKDRDGSNIKLYYPGTQVTSYLLQGGDGNYTMTCDKPEVVEAKLVRSMDSPEMLLELTALTLGDATITITDKSDNSLLININVDYYTQEFIVSNYDVFLTGNLDDSDKKALAEKAAATIPVKVGGGYKFVYTDAEEAIGNVFMYKEKYGSQPVEGTFERKNIKQEDDTFGTVGYINYELTFPDGKYTFRFTTYQPSNRTSVMPVVAFYEDVLEKFSADYPALESVYTAQILSQVSDLFY